MISTVSTGHPKSPSNLDSHIACFDASPSAMYSASIVDNAADTCRVLAQQIAPPARENKYPVVDLRVS